MELILLVVVAVLLIALVNRLLGVDPLICILVAVILIALIYGVPHFNDPHRN